MDKPDAWMPHYIGDYLIETIHLTPQQDGIYMRLRSHYWKNGGPIPDDSKTICRAVRVTSQAEFDDVQYILKSFFKLVNGHYHHTELDKRYQDACKQYTKRSEAGKKAVAARELKKMIAIDTSNDEPTKPTTRATTKSITKTDSHIAAAEDVPNNSQKRGMTYEEIEQFYIQTFNVKLNDKELIRIFGTFITVPYDYILSVFNMASENGITDYNYVLNYLDKKMSPYKSAK